VLKFIRKNAGALWVKLIFGTIAVVFVFWGVAGSVANGSKQDVVVKINEDEIESLKFVRAHDNLFRLYESIYKDNFKPELARMLDLKGKTVDQLVRVSLLRQEAERLGLHASDAEVRNAIAAMKGFQNEMGAFDKELYLRVLRANRLTAGEFEDSEREEILVNKLQDVITAGIHVSETEALDQYKFENEKVSLRFLKVEPSAFVDQVAITDADVQSHFDANQEEFRETEKARVEFVHYSVAAYTAKAEVSDADLQKYYDDHKSDFEKPEQVQARHILLKLDESADDEQKAAVRKQAEELLAKAKAGDDFAELATANSQDEGSAPKGGDLGSFGRGMMVPPFEEAAFALAPGQISDIVESAFGLHIIKVEGKTEARTQSLDEVRADILARLRGEKARELAQAQANGDHAKAAEGQALGELAQAAGLELSAPEPFAQSDMIPGVGRGPLLNAVFAAEGGKVGPVVDTPTGFYVFAVKEKIAPRVPALTEIRDRVEKSLREKKSQELAKTKAAEALVELQKSGDLDAVAASLKLTADETSEFPRQGTYIAKIGSSPELKSAAFTLTTEQRVAPAVYDVSGTSVLAVLKERVAADEAKFQEEKADLIRQAADRRKGQALEEFVNYLKARAKVEVNQEYLAAIPDTGRPLGSRF